MKDLRDIVSRFNRKLASYETPTGTGMLFKHISIEGKLE